MTTKGALRLAVVGCGNMGKRHVEVIRATEGASLVAVQDQDIDLARLAANNQCHVAENYAELLARRDVDGVVLCIPSALHAQYGLEAARAGKHVTTEKPIDSSPAAAEQLIKECETARVGCAVIHQYRFSDGNLTVKQALENKQLGAPRLVRASVKWFRHDEYYSASTWRGRIEGEGGGVLINQAIHAIDLLCWFFGQPVAVSGFVTKSRAAMETEDTAVAILRFKNNVLATLEASTSAHPGFDDQMEIYGEHASIMMQKNEIVEWHSANGMEQPAAPSAFPPSEGLAQKLVLLQRQYRNILAALRGEAELLVKPREALLAVQVVREIYDQQK